MSPGSTVEFSLGIIQGSFIRIIALTIDTHSEVDLIHGVKICIIQRVRTDDSVPVERQVASITAVLIYNEIITPAMLDMTKA